MRPEEKLHEDSEISLLIANLLYSANNEKCGTLLARPHRS